MTQFSDIELSGFSTAFGQSFLIDSELDLFPNDEEERKEAFDETAAYDISSVEHSEWQSSLHRIEGLMTMLFEAAGISQEKSSLTASGIILDPKEYPLVPLQSRGESESRVAVGGLKIRRSKNAINPITSFAGYVNGYHGEEDIVAVDYAVFNVTDFVKANSRFLSLNIFPDRSEPNGGPLVTVRPLTKTWENVEQRMTDFTLLAIEQK